MLKEIPHLPMNIQESTLIMDCDHPDWLRDVDPLGTKYCMYCNEDLEAPKNGKS